MTSEPPGTFWGSAGMWAIRTQCKIVSWQILWCRFIGKVQPPQDGRLPPVSHSVSIINAIAAA
jgi:hypothetical protein